MEFGEKKWRGCPGLLGRLERNRKKTRVTAGENIIKKMKMSEPVISVIVPIYNVEKYVRKCLDSLAAQTMREIEVICIDDGSTDRSGEIAEEYKKDERFRVIHTENRGLSAARNRGIEESRASWLMFVDSDDWVDERFCEIPYKAATENDADLVCVCFRSYRVTRFGHIEKPKKNNAPTGIVNEMTAHKFGGSTAWNKLYRKGLFKEVKYPEGRVYEDIATTHKVIHSAERILMKKECLYYHRIRNSSIAHTHDSQNNRDKFIAVLEKSKDLQSYGHSNREVQRLRQIGAIQYLARSSPNQDELYEIARNIVDSCEKIPERINYRQKIVFLARKNNMLFSLISQAIRCWQL